MPCATIRQNRRRAPRLSRSPKTQTAMPGPRSPLDSTVCETKIPSPKMRLIAQAPSTSGPRRCSRARTRAKAEARGAAQYLHLLHGRIDQVVGVAEPAAHHVERAVLVAHLVPDGYCDLRSARVSRCRSRVSADVVRAFQTRLAARGHPSGREQALTRQHPRATKLPQRARCLTHVFEVGDAVV
jgi:hypothetical protein